MNRILSLASGWLTATGATAIIVTSIEGYISGKVKAEEAIFQGALGVIALGLRRAIALIFKKDAPTPPQV